MMMMMMDRLTTVVHLRSLIAKTTHLNNHFFYRGAMYSNEPGMAVSFEYSYFVVYVRTYRRKKPKNDK